MPAGTTYRALAAAQFTSSIDDYALAEYARAPRLATATEVEIRVHAAAVNIIDVYRAMGALTAAFPVTPPVRFGYDVAGVVARAGEQAAFRAGDRVYGCVGHADIGTVGEYVVTDCSNLARIPDAVAFVAAAGVPLAGLTAKQALDAGGAREGQTVHVTGGLGGVGMFASFLARRHYGAREVTATVSAAKVRQAEALGAATRVVDYRDAAAVASLEGSADLVLDAVGDQALSCAIVKRDGSGTVSSVVRWAPEDVARLEAAGVRYVHTFAVQSGSQLEDTFSPLLADGALQPVVEVFPFSDDGARAAYAKCLAGHATGKIVIRVRDD
ncbi:hypothetical protein H4217_000370 [Coemansia sp. RSA 1939]|nr:hypothetical protein H4217_000370 [Coemansia sp. RSA 1939]KAJ2616839.1 hypothetical protein EV177_000866 [Coemansia sp. RSA 1804]